MSDIRLSGFNQYCYSVNSITQKSLLTLISVKCFHISRSKETRKLKASNNLIIISGESSSQNGILNRGIRHVQ